MFFVVLLKGSKFRGPPTIICEASLTPASKKNTVCETLGTPVVPLVPFRPTGRKGLGGSALERTKTQPCRHRDPPGSSGLPEPNQPVRGRLGVANAFTHDATLEMTPRGCRPRGARAFWFKTAWWRPSEAKEDQASCLVESAAITARKH